MSLFGRRERWLHRLHITTIDKLIKKERLMIDSKFQLTNSSISSDSTSTTIPNLSDNFEPRLPGMLLQGSFHPQEQFFEQKLPLARHGQAPLFVALLQILPHLQLVVPGSDSCLLTDGALMVKTNAARKSPNNPTMV